MTPEVSKFCSNFPWNAARAAYKIKSLIEWFDFAGICELDNGNLAKIELVSRLQAGAYVGFLVKIINIKRGLIDEHYFPFDLYLNSKDFKDIRCGGKGDSSPLPPFNGFYATSGIKNNFSWYIFEPKNTASICDAILKYISTFES